MKIKPINLLTLALLCFSVSIAQAQSKKGKNKEKENTFTRTENEQGIHLEFDAKEAEDFKTLPLGNDGMLIYFDDKDGKRGLKSYTFIKFDKDLNEEYRTSYAVPKGLEIERTVENGNKVYFMLFKSSSNLYGDHLNSYTIVRFDPATKEFKSFEGKLAKGAYFVDMEVVNDVAYVNTAIAPSPGALKGYLCLNLPTCFIPMLTGLTKVNFKPQFITHSLSTKSQKYLNHGYQKRKGHVVAGNFSVNDSTNDVSLMFFNHHKKINTIWFKQVDSKGNAGKDINVKIAEGKFLSGMRMAEVGDKKIFYGQYGPKPKSLSFGKSQTLTATQGIGFGVVGKSGAEKVALIPYNKIKGFKPLTSTAEKRAIKKGEKKGKEAAINLRVHFGEPMIYNDEVIIAGEVYYATFRTEFYVDANGRTRTRQVFDGWAFTDIMLASFDINGNLLWSNSIPYSRPKSFYIYQRIKTTLQEDGNVRVVYNDGFKVMSTLINGTEKVSTKTYSINAGSKKGDKVKAAATEESGSDIAYWYNDYYLVNGVQKVKNKAVKGKDRTRNIFYVKRIEIAEE